MPPTSQLSHQTTCKVETRLYMLQTCCPHLEKPGVLPHDINVTGWELIGNLMSCLISGVRTFNNWICTFSHLVPPDCLICITKKDGEGVTKYKADKPTGYKLLSQDMLNPTLY